MSKSYRNSQTRSKAQPNSPQVIARAWDQLCDSYIADLADIDRRKALAAIELAAIRQELTPRRNLAIFDAGCGPGFHSLQLAPLMATTCSCATFR